MLSVLGVWFVFSAHAQEPPRTDRNEGGTLINQDYFTADQYPETKALLRSVEDHHLHNQVWTDFYTGQLSLVVPDLRYTLDKFPNHPTALLVLVSVAKQSKDLSLPIPFFQKALRIYPQYAVTHAQYGTFLVDAGLIHKGIEHLKMASEIDPDLVAAHVYLAKAYLALGDAELARQSAERARALGYKGEISSAERHE